MVSTASVRSSSESELVSRHRSGDEEAFAEIFERYRGLVYNLAYRMVGRSADAQDLTQEVFLRIYRHLGSFEGRSSLETWIYRVTVNHCKNKLRRRRLRLFPLEGQDGRERPLADERRGPEERAVADDERRRVHRAVARIPSPFREAVVLRDLEGLTYREIAEVLEVGIGTVRSRIARGRQRLREILEEDEP